MGEGGDGCMQSDRQKVLAALGPSHADLSLHLLHETDSTNLRLKEGCRAGIYTAPCLMIAESQTSGRGRLGRAFISPSGTGLYMSLLCRPETPWSPGKITLLAAVAVCLAIEEMTGLRPKIKWVNDLFLRGRKICGILAEGAGEQVIVGIGVNLKTPPGGFPDTAGIAGALDVPLDRLSLAGAIARHFLDGLRQLHHPDILRLYRARMPLIGREITFLEKGQQKNARVTGVDEDGGLMIVTDEGPQVLRSGEVSLGSASFSGLE